MIIEQKTSDVVVIGENKARQATISAEEMSKLQYLLTKGLYKDPITAVIAEWANNGVDSVVQSGKDPIENPVIVSIGRNNLNQYTFSVEDKGTGLDDNDFENVCMNYLKSTKDKSNKFIGSYGIGMKSFLSLNRSATFVCRKDGVERTYLVYQGEEFVNYDLVNTKNTTEPNGVRAQLIIEDYTEKCKFIEKIYTKLAYYDTVLFVQNGIPYPSSIFRNDLFQWSSVKFNKMHLCIKDVYYEIDWNLLGITPISVPVALRFGLEDGIVPTPSRESYISTTETNNLILNKIKEVATFFVERYNSKVKEFAKFMDGLEYYSSNSYYVSLEDRTFNIDDLIKHSKISILVPKVKGIYLRSPKFYHNKRHHFISKYTLCSYIDVHGTHRKVGGRFKPSKDQHFFYERRKCIVVDESFLGNVKEYLVRKHGKEVMFFKEDAGKRRLWGVSSKEAGYTYVDILELKTISKSEWRKYIEEWNMVEKSVQDEFIDERGVENTQVYLTWLENKRKEQREARLLGKASPSYSGLNKELGDVTLAYSYKSLRGISFKKTAYKISHLPENHYLTVLLQSEDNTEWLRDMIDALSSTTVKFAIVGKNERKKIPNCSQFINFQQFMTIDYKPFMRLASAILFRDLLDTVDKINSLNILSKCISGYEEHYKVLDRYSRENMNTSTPHNVRGSIIDVARAKDLFDKTLWDSYLALKNIAEKYSFVALLKEPARWDSKAQEDYGRTINQMLLFRKKYYDDLKNAVIVIREPKNELEEAV